MGKAYLVLRDGRYFEGTAIGADGEAVGELVFNTGVVGYIETLTDPSSAGQIVMQTFPLVGNYGMIDADAEGACAVRGYVVRELCDAPSNFRCESTLDEYLKKQGVCGICGVDTREITRILREEGVMNAKICTSLPESLDDIEAYKVSGAVAQVSRKEKEVCPAQGEKKFSIALIDYGTRRTVLRALCARGCEVTVYPHDARAEDILACSPDGVVLSDGPGDPAENEYLIAQIGEIVGKVPVLGIGLGHLMTAIAMGAQTTKLRYGHHGANQPVRETGGNRTFITAQNHGYEVVTDSIKCGEITFVNANDASCEGIEYEGKNCFTVAFAPDEEISTRSTAFLYDRFISMMGGGRDA
ncbi:MAG: carbamoyl phosphate synthase small subunit [Clostridia bacterium]|nr:carbamoyl phosphate synthase small subunit [Clostridia bacterium]